MRPHAASEKRTPHLEEVEGRDGAMVPPEPPMAHGPQTDITPTPPLLSAESRPVRRSSRLRIPPDRWEPSF